MQFKDGFIVSFIIIFGTLSFLRYACSCSVVELSCCDDGETQLCRESCRQSLSSRHLSQHDAVTVISQHCGPVHYAVSSLSYHIVSFQKFMVRPLLREPRP